MSVFSRREALKAIAAAASAVGISVAPGVWERPEVEASTLPRVAAASSAPSPTAVATPMSTPSPTPVITPAVAITSITPGDGLAVTSLTPLISGTIEPATAGVTVTVDGVAQTPVVVQPDGTWSVTAAFNPEEPSHIVVATHGEAPTVTDMRFVMYAG